MRADDEQGLKKRTAERLSRLYGEWLYIRGACVKCLLEHDEKGAAEFIRKQREVEWKIVAAHAKDIREVAYKFEILRDMLMIESINRDALQMLTSIEADLRDL